MMLIPLLFACGTPEATSSTPTASAPKSAPEAAKAAVYNGRFAGDAKLSPEAAAQIPADQVRILRNEIFAKHGRAFKSEDLQKHFGAQAWYTVDPGFTDSKLSATDRANVALLKSFEGDMGKKALAMGEYNGQNRTLALVDPKTAEILDSDEDMYNSERMSRHWTSMGSWVITWEGGPRFDAGSAKEAQLWELDHTKGRVLSVRDLKLLEG